MTSPRFGGARSCHAGVVRFLMVIGFVVAALGLLVIALTTRWVKPWGNQYSSTNRPLTGLGWLLLVGGLGVAVVAAWANGQLG